MNCSDEREHCSKGKTRFSPANLRFPVGLVLGLLHRGNASERLDAGATVCLAAMLEYLTGEILELADNAARDKNKRIISQGKVLPCIQALLLLKRIQGHHKAKEK